MKKVVILGPESTGKSTLTLWLSEYFKGCKVEEYAREYLTIRNNLYVEEDLLKIAEGQLLLEDKIEMECTSSGQTPIIFHDTDLTVIKIWSEYKYGKCDQWILKQYNRRQYDLYLLTFPDLEWHPDPMRENPEDRMKIYDLYLNDLTSRNVNFRIIRGIGEERTRNAMDIVNSLLK